MTEPEWLAAASPSDMLRFLGNAGQRLHRVFLPPPRLEASLQRFVIGLARRVYASLEDPRSRRVVDAFEEWVDGLASHATVLAARVAAHRAMLDAQRGERPWPPAWDRARAAHALPFVVGKQPIARANRVSGLLLDALVRTRVGTSLFRSDVAEADERSIAAAMLRDAIGNPFRRRPFDPAWRTANADAIAQAIHESRDFTAAPILADALEEAGCDDPEILAHLRSPVPHVRGCWAICDILS